MAATPVTLNLRVSLPLPEHSRVSARRLKFIIHEYYTL